MTRQDYEALAQIIRNEHERSFNSLPRPGADLFGDHTLVSGYLERVADQAAAYMHQQNPRFDRERFMTACGF